MDAEIIYDSPLATMYYYPDTKIIHHEIHLSNEPWKDNEFRELMMLGSRTLAEKGAQKWLSDDRNTLAVNKMEYQWGHDYWFPETLKRGWKHWAIVQPKHLIAQLNLEIMVKEYAAQGINAMFFTEVDKAMDWLVKQ